VLFLLAILGVISGALFVADSLRIPAEVKNKTAVAPADYIAPAATLVVEIVLGCLILVLGLRTLRHVIWRAK
jgi:hypothetical protein